MSKRRRATNVSQKVRKEVMERDKWCILCGNPRNLTAAHYISRAQGGLGVKENIVALCIKCHHDFDHTTKRANIKVFVKSYLENHYGKIDDNDLKYRRY